MKRIRYILPLILSAIAAMPAAKAQDISEIRGMAEDNAAGLLRGMFPGVSVSAIDNNPNGALNVNIRGVNSLRTDNQPLWIVDGVMLSQDLNQNLDAFWQFGEMSYTAPLDPLASIPVSQIESIEVVKDISSLALYGGRGANGVVIVTTKSGLKGKELVWSSKLGLNSNASFSSPLTLSHKHTVSMRGGNERTHYNIAGEFSDAKGATPRSGSRFGRLAARLDARANKTVWFGMNAKVSLGKTENPSGTAWLGRPSYMLALRDASLSPGTSARQWLDDYDDDSRDYRALVGSYITLNILKGLKLDIEGGADLQADDRIIWYGASTEMGAAGPDNPNGGAAATLTASMFSYNGSAKLDYRRFFAGTHMLHLAAGGELTGSNYYFNTMNGTDFASHVLRGKGLGLSGSLPRNQILRSIYFREGAWACLEYSWDDKIGFRASCRMDYTPKYRQYGTRIFPAGEAFADLHKLFFRKAGVLSSLMLKAGYGIGGREQYIPYGRTRYYLSGEWLRPEPGQESFCDGVDYLETQEYHISASAGLLKDRIRVSLTWYDRLTEDKYVLYSFSSAPNITRYGTFYKRVTSPSEMFSRSSSISNKGFEASLEAVPVASGDWRWQISLNGAYNLNRMESSNVDDYHGRAVGHGIFCSCNVVGSPVSSLYGYKADAAGNYLDTTGEGRITPADKTILGNTIPKFTAALNSRLSWRRLSFEIALDAATGHQRADINTLVRDGVTDTDGKVVLSSKYVQDASFLRLDYAGLEYQIPWKTRRIKETAVRFAVKNPFLITKYDGWNPDVNSFGVNALSNGFDYGSFPFVRSFIAGISVKF